MGLTVGIEEGQAVEALVVLWEAAQAEEQRTDTHFHQHASLVAAVCGQGFRHLYHLGGWLWFLLALTDWGLRGGLLRGGWLWGRGCDR